VAAPLELGAAVGLSAASAYVATRVLESTVIVVGLISLLAVVTLREDLAGAANSDPATLDAMGRALVAIKDGTSCSGPPFCAGLGNGLLLGYLMHRSGTRPAAHGPAGPHRRRPERRRGDLRAVRRLGATSATQAILTLPEIAWEASLGIYLIVTGFKPSPVLA